MPAAKTTLWNRMRFSFRKRWTISASRILERIGLRGGCPPRGQRRTTCFSTPSNTPDNSVRMGEEGLRIYDELNN